MRQHNTLCLHHPSLAHYLPMLVALRSSTVFIGLNKLQEDTNHKQICKKGKNMGFPCRWDSALSVLSPRTWKYSGLCEGYLPSKDSMEAVGRIGTGFGKVPFTLAYTRIFCWNLVKCVCPLPSLGRQAKGCQGNCMTVYVKTLPITISTEAPWASRQYQIPVGYSYHTSPQKQKLSQPLYETGWQCT